MRLGLWVRFFRVRLGRGLAGYFFVSLIGCVGIRCAHHDRSPAPGWRRRCGRGAGGGVFGLARFRRGDRACTVGARLFQVIDSGFGFCDGLTDSGHGRVDVGTLGGQGAPNGGGEVQGGGDVPEPGDVHDGVLRISGLLPEPSGIEEDDSFLIVVVPDLVFADAAVDDAAVVESGGCFCQCQERFVRFRRGQSEVGNQGGVDVFVGDGQACFCLPGGVEYMVVSDQSAHACDVRVVFDPADGSCPFSENVRGCIQCVCFEHEPIVFCQIYAVAI